MPIKITAAQCEALYVQALDHLSGIGDLWLAIDAGEYEKASRLGHEFADDVRLLLDDLGWRERRRLPAEGWVELTTPPHDLRHVIRRLRDEAAEMFADNLPCSEERALLDRTGLAVEACGRILAAIERGEDAE